MEAVVCDTKGDANGEVGCARKLVDEGVVATVNDLAYNNPAGVDEVLQNAGIPRIGLGSTGVGTTSLSFPLSTGIVGAYMGDAVGFKNRGKTKVVLVRTDAATGAGFADFLRPYFKQAGVDIVGDVAIATGSTDYAPYVAQIQRANPDAVLFAIDDTSAAQLIAAMAQLNYKPLLGGHPGTFTLETLQKFKDNTTGTLLAESFPYPSQSNVKQFPALKQFFADMKASKQKILDPANIQPTSLYPWVSTLAFVNAMKAADGPITKDTVIQALEDRQGHRPDGARRTVDTLRAGVQRLHRDLEPVRLRLEVRRQERRHGEAVGRRQPVLQVARKPWLTSESEPEQPMWRQRAVTRGLGAGPYAGRGAGRRTSSTRPGS